MYSPRSNTDALFLTQRPEFVTLKSENEKNKEKYKNAERTLLDLSSHKK